MQEWRLTDEVVVRLEELSLHVHRRLRAILDLTKGRSTMFEAVSRRLG